MTRPLPTATPTAPVPEPLTWRLTTSDGVFRYELPVSERTARRMIASGAAVEAQVIGGRSATGPTK